MTMFSPNIRVERLYVSALGRSVYDEAFHNRLNIIRGENSSGKSTILDFIFFALGGDLSSWRETALRCDTVFIQVMLNGRTAVLSRDVAQQSNRPMRIYLGNLDEALQSASNNWQVFPYSRGAKESFSQVLFRYLGLPEVQYGDNDTKITMNQILRLLYADQLSPVEKLFRAQRFDDAVTRLTVGDLLCGAFSSRFYQAKLRLIQAHKEYENAETKIGFLVQSYSQGSHPLTMEWLQAETEVYRSTLEATNEEIRVLEERIFHAQFDDRLSLNDQNATYARIVELQGQIARTKEELSRIEFDIADASLFIQSMEEKLLQLQQAGSVLKDLGVIEYDVCPSCLATVEEKREGHCRLCHSSFDPQEVNTRSLRQINEVARQIQESTDLQIQHAETLASLRKRLATLEDLWEQAGRHYSVSVRSPTTETRLKLRELNREAGYITKKLEELAGTAGVIKQLSDLYELKEALNNEISELKRVIESENDRNAKRITSARQNIAFYAIEFLKRDLARQSTFERAQNVSIEFDADRIAVNGDSFFSASSMVYLKNSVLAGFLLAAANDQQFYHPRFLLMDTVEDKGMEPERSQNFQKLLYEYSQAAISDHQIIIATSMIAPELNIPSITVGEFYTHENRTLQFSPEKSP